LRPKSLNLEDGFKDITYVDFARAINRVAAWLEKKYDITIEKWLGV